MSLDSINVGSIFENHFTQCEDPSIYPHEIVGPILVRETHISWILLAGERAYKIKKPIKTDFLDYSTLEKREWACREELRLCSRYAEELYEAVVPISVVDGKLRVDFEANPIEYAVKMKRFSEGSLLSQRIGSKLVTPSDMAKLGLIIARFHTTAEQIQELDASFANVTLQQALDNFDAIKQDLELGKDAKLLELEAWTGANYAEHRRLFEFRAKNGFVRDCHGDLHSENIVYWQEEFVPFDGIEFNAAFTKIDVLNDLAFLIMDLLYLNSTSNATLVLNAYLQETGDYSGIPLLRWYVVYRALVRAKVSMIRAHQMSSSEDNYQAQLDSIRKHIELAHAIAHWPTPSLWITHGLSGSGKTYGSEEFMLNHGAIRIRSDVERKRMFRSDTTASSDIYSSTATQETYERLMALASEILRAGYSVIVDATFLKFNDRQRFRDLAGKEKAGFGILDFVADERTLVRRIEERLALKSDASDATVEVLRSQLANQEPLSKDERSLVCNRL